MPLFDMNVEDMPTFEPVPEGDYDAVVSAAELAESKNGEPMIVFTFQLQDSDPDVNGRKLKYWHMLPGDPKGEYYRLRLQTTRALCEALGIEGNPEVEDFVGASAKVRIEHEEYNGEMRDRIVRVHA